MGDYLDELLVACMYCGLVRESRSKERWRPITAREVQEFENRISHGICPACVPRFLENFLEEKEE